MIVVHILFAFGLSITSILLPGAALAMPPRKKPAGKSGKQTAAAKAKAGAAPPLPAAVVGQPPAAGSTKGSKSSRIKLLMAKPSSASKRGAGTPVIGPGRRRRSEEFVSETEPSVDDEESEDSAATPTRVASTWIMSHHIPQLSTLMLQSAVCLLFRPC